MFLKSLCLVLPQIRRNYRNLKKIRVLIMKQCQKFSFLSLVNHTNCSLSENKWISHQYLTQNSISKLSRKRDFDKKQYAITNQSQGIHAGTDLEKQTALSVGCDARALGLQLTTRYCNDPSLKVAYSLSQRLISDISLVPMLTTYMLVYLIAFVLVIDFP